MTLGKKGVAGDNTSRDLFNQPNHGSIYVSGASRMTVMKITKSR
jgi:hypothetical protein